MISKRRVIATITTVGAVGSSLDAIRDTRAFSKVEVVSGVLENDCIKLLTDSFKGKGYDTFVERILLSISLD